MPFRYVLRTIPTVPLHDLAVCGGERTRSRDEARRSLGVLRAFSGRMRVRAHERALRSPHGAASAEWDAARLACASDGRVPVEQYQWAVVRREAALRCELPGEMMPGAAPANR
jgi:hypothetical protein